MRRHFRILSWPAAIGVAAVAVASVGRRFEPVIVRGDSMQPLLRPGDRLAVWKSPVATSGRIVVIQGPSGLPLVKRVVAIAGESYDDQVVPDGHVFVVGDNLRASTDSKVFGALPVIRVEGVALAIWWPPSRARIL